LSPIESEFISLADTLERWAPFLAGLPDERFHQLEDLLYAEAKAAAAEGDRELEAFYATLGGICSYYFKPEEPLDPYGPMMVMNGSRTAIPADLRDCDLDALSRMLPELRPAGLRARAADVLWIRRRDQAAAQIAVTSYIDASRRWPDDWIHDAIEQVERALQIAAQLGRGGAYLATQTVDRIREMLGEPDIAAIGPRRHLLRLLLGYREIGGLESELDEAAQRASELLAAGSYSDARLWFELAAELAAGLDRTEDYRRHCVAAAETWVSEAEIAASGEAPSHMRAAGLIEFAIKSLRGVGGMRERIDELHQKMLGWQGHTTGEMQQFSAEIDLTDFVQHSIERVSGKPLPQALVAMALAYGYRDVQHIRDEVMRLMQEHPLQFLFSKSILDSKGRVVARPPSMSTSDDDETEAAIQAEMFSQARTTMGIVVQGSINPARRTVLAEHPLSYAVVLQLIGPSPFIPAGHEQMYAKGIWAGFNGDFATAAAILAPELEDAIREEMDRHGVMLPRLDAYAIHKARQLGEYLYCAGAEAVYGPDKLFMLKAVLCNDFGADMRDRVAHGLLSYPEYMSTESAFLWWLALRLAIEPMIQVVGDDDSAQAPGEEANDFESGGRTNGST
jgi:Domain of unknown function (DUF4209)